MRSPNWDPRKLAPAIVTSALALPSAALANNIDAHPSGGTGLDPSTIGSGGVGFPEQAPGSGGVAVGNPETNLADVNSGAAAAVRGLVRFIHDDKSLIGTWSFKQKDGIFTETMKQADKTKKAGYVVEVAGRLDPKANRGNQGRPIIDADELEVGLGAIDRKGDLKPAKSTELIAEKIAGVWVLKEQKNGRQSWYAATGTVPPREQLTDGLTRNFSRAASMIIEASETSQLVGGNHNGKTFVAVFGTPVSDVHIDWPLPPNGTAHNLR
ncbi:MAG TPA: hypothetical protein VLG27_03230 [Candidatus Saccharimonadia bacterium]|nr:hypothetical protein [Candidatus Saccharimonadia bacterium]